MQPLVSVVIPTYNHAHFLTRALQSVLDQTYTNWEAIIIDNHSEDDTAAVIDTFPDTRIRRIMIHNQGIIAASRNLGMRNARGSWIAFLDSDDYWYPAKLETVIGYLEANPLLDVVSTDEMLVDTNSGRKQVLRYGPYEKDFYKAMILTGNRLSPSATLVRTEFIRQHDIFFSESKEYITVEDYDLWLKLALAGARFHFIHAIQGEYVLHANNSSAQMERHNKNAIKLVHDHIFQIQKFDPSPQRLWKKVLPRLQMAQVGQLMANGQKGKAIKTIAVALLSNPVNSAAFLFKKIRALLNK
jgi:glycosyltransferase involved in cell wall biosynthesis